MKRRASAAKKIVAVAVVADIAEIVVHSVCTSFVM